MRRSNGRTGWQTLREPLTHRPLYRTTSAHGSDVWVIPMAGFRKSYAMVTTRFGSLDTELPDGTPLPDGIAHFLEHKMFQTQEGDVFDLYAARGASANAFTSFDHTSYLFSCTSRFEDNLDTLLRTMAAIETDEEGVERERGIIGQEIAMYHDDPSWRGYFRLLSALYRKHPVRIDIAGTPETIARIDPPLLRRAHAAFYHPRNLIVVVAGDVDRALVLERTNALLRARGSGRRHRRAATSEPRSVALREARETLSVSRPWVYLGLKDTPPGTTQRRIRRQVLSSLALDILCGDGGRIQDALYGDGLVDDSFSAGFECDRDYAFGLVCAEVDAPDAFRARLQRELARVAGSGVTEAEVERSRRRFLGRHVRVWNAPEELASWALGVALEGGRLETGIDVLMNAGVRAVNRRLREIVSAPRAWCTIAPTN